MSVLPGKRAGAGRRRALQLALAPLLGLGAVLLVACGSSNSKLIPLANAGPLQSDFQEVAEKAETANGNCGPTEQALQKLEQDFGALPSSTDPGLRARLHEGITNLHSRALTACQQPGTQTAGTTSTTKTDTTTTDTTPTQTQSTTTAPPQTTTTPPQTTPANPATPETGGVAPETEKPEKPTPPAGGTGAGDGNGPGNGAGNGAGGQEGGR